MALTLRQWRKAREITQEKMADRLGVHINTYQNWEKEPGKITIENSKKIAEILGVPLDDISFSET
ncbi:MAG: helix-turn-helix transcriptional regulator [Lachnospiraceae bacterium]|nr:helix-turn-helix transcriptional regulator [Lachnospiraceae bacterium]MBR3182771.1 helix-turn-helix transcriptional regulator [Bacillota bacterium]MBR3374207.1 helix-turn-helix transcriptional regulator [Bacillota bacterium]